MAALMSSAAAQAGDFALALGVHRGKAAQAAALAAGVFVALVGRILQRHVDPFR
jgi:hypothetical protein